MQTMAAVVTMPGREGLVGRVLESLRPQVDRLAVYLNGFSECPEELRGLVDDFQCDPGNIAGDTGNLFWSDKHDGLYFSCDDDLIYSQQYVDIMRYWLDKYHGRVITTIHGIQFQPRALTWAPESWRRRMTWSSVYLKPLWLHQPGSGVMGFHTDLKIPSQWPEKNNADLFLAIWAQENQVPVLGLPHGGWEVQNILPKEAWSIFKESAQTSHKRRDELVRSVYPWRTFKYTNGVEQKEG